MRKASRNWLPTHGTNAKSSGTSAVGGAGYWIVYGAITIAVLFVNVLTEPDRYADFDSYIYYLDTLVHFPPPSWLYFEVLSNFFLLGMHWIARSVLSGVELAHYALGVFFVLMLPAVYRPRSTPWPGLLLSFAMLGPLLAFVTIRATPAYFLVAIAVRLALKRRPAAWACLAVASFFHISALVAAAPLAVVYFERHLPALLRSDRSRQYYLIVMLGIVALGAALPQLSDSVIGLIRLFPVLSKYEVYTDPNSAVTQIGHYIYLAFVSLLTFMFMVVRNQASARLSMYVLMSFTLYVVMFFTAAPVAAFRQTPFWIIPMIAVLPWERFGVRHVTVPFFVLACVALMVLQFSQVYDRGV